MKQQLQNLKFNHRAYGAICELKRVYSNSWNGSLWFNSFWSLALPPTFFFFLQWIDNWFAHVAYMWISNNIYTSWSHWTFYYGCITGWMVDQNATNFRRWLPTVPERCATWPLLGTSTGPAPLEGGAFQRTYPKYFLHKELPTLGCMPTAGVALQPL